MTTTERRNFKRFKVDVPVQVGTNDPQISVPGIVRDISQGGALIEMDEPLPAVGSTVSIAFKIATVADSLQCQGTVVWTTVVALSPGGPRGVGMKLSGLGPEDIAAIVGPIYSAP